jgi:hypothetical protein
MDLSEIRRWALFFLCILAAIVIADTLSKAVLGMLGISGPARFIAGFVLYAGLFFAILYGIESLTGLRFFSFGR